VIYILKVLDIAKFSLYLRMINVFYMEKPNRTVEVLTNRKATKTCIAKQMDRHFSTVNTYCSQRLQPSLSTLSEIEKILDVDMKNLITDKHERK
jgi:putative transcriptional regulator